jgi:hypothetical protein
MRIALFFILLALVSCNPRNRKWVNQDKNHCSSSGINLTSRISGDTLQIKFSNAGQSTKFLFVSYLNNRFQYNKYLLRKSKEHSEVTISYVPITKYVHTVKSDVVRIVDEAILTPQQVTYDFLEISPDSSITIQFKISSIKRLLQSDSIYVIDPKDFSIIKPNMIPFRESQQQSVSLVFAIFCEKKWLTIKGAEYDRRSKGLFLRNAIDYDILKMKIFPTSENVSK